MALIQWIVVHGRSSLMESLVWLIPFLCVDLLSVGGVVCLLNSVSVCTEKKMREERGEKESKREQEKAKERNPANSGFIYRHFPLFFYPPDRRLTYRQIKLFMLFL